MTKKLVHFIVNPISGATQKLGIVEKIKSFVSPDINYEILFTEYAGHATKLTQDAINAGAKAVVAVGGDGSVNEVGRTLVNTDIALGVIPCGSGNGFARHLNIPLDVKSSIETICAFKINRIDTGLVNEQVFLATTGTGFDAHVAHKFADFGKRGFLSYMQVSTNEFINYQPQSYEITIDGKIQNFEAFLIVVANASQYGNNVWIAPSASVTDGLLNIGVFKKFTVAVMPDIIFRLFNKTIENANCYQAFTGKEIIIKSIVNYHLDGEPMNDNNEMHIKIVPNSLNVLC